MHPANQRSDRVLFRPELRARYVVDGQPIEGIAVGSYWSQDRADAEQVLARFTPGSRHTMRYRPSDPRDLRFDVAPDFATFKWTFFALGGALVLAAVAIVAFRRA